jgi:hypothetical protein
MPALPAMSSDTMGLIANLAELVDGPLPSIAVRLLIADEIEKRYRPHERSPRVPGMVFGPTGLPPGHGTSTEIVVDQRLTRRALEALFEVLSAQASQRNHLLGAVAVRFVSCPKAARCSA